VASDGEAVGAETDWARRRWARVVRELYTQGPLRLLSALVAPRSVEGLEQIEGIDGPVVLVANHTSHADTMVITLSLPHRRRRRLVVAAAADYFFSNPVTSWLSSLFVGAIPVERDRASRRLLDLCHRLLGEGWSLLLYPEGGRSPNGEMQEFKPGAAWIARRSGVPVIPVHLSGTYQVLPKGRTLPRRHRVRVRFGAPLALVEGEDARSFNRRIEAAVRKLAD
jgi:1-acyl-sn-glycerol-3-phosphate acyltransferase